MLETRKSLGYRKAIRTVYVVEFNWRDNQWCPVCNSCNSANDYFGAVKIKDAIVLFNGYKKEELRVALYKRAERED